MTRAHDIGLLLSDIDGTLVTDDRVLTPAAVAAVKSLDEAGIRFALTSARPPYGMRMLIAPLDVRLPLSGFNGGLIVDTDFTVLESHPIDPHVAEEAVRLIRTDGLDLWVYTDNEWIVTATDGPHVAPEIRILDMQPVARAVTAADLARAYKIVGVSDDHAKVAATHQRIIAQLRDAVSATSSEPHFIDMTHPKANKGAVVHALAGRLALDPARIATIGDMPNDVLMFVQSGFSIAMGNASPEVQGKASVVTTSNEQDGFADAVRRFILPPERTGGPLPKQDTKP